MTSDRTALLLIRAWVEQGSSSPLRADVRQTADVSAGFERSSTLTDAEGVTDIVRAWLDTIMADERNDADALGLP